MNLLMFYRGIKKKAVTIETKKAPRINGKLLISCSVITLTTHNLLSSGLDGTRTRDPLRDRQVF